MSAFSNHFYIENDAIVQINSNQDAINANQPNSPEWEDPLLLIESGKRVYEMPSNDVFSPFFVVGNAGETETEIFQRAIHRMFGIHKPITMFRSENTVHIGTPYIKVNKVIYDQLHNMLNSMSKDVQFTAYPHIPLFLTPESWDSGHVVDDPIYTNGALAALSILYADSPWSPTPLIKRTASDKKKSTIADTIMNHTLIIYDDKEYARGLVPLISLDRCKDTGNMITMGKILHKTFRGDPEGLSLWKSLIDEELHAECNDQWEKLNDYSDGVYSIKSLQYWARVDCPDKYTEWTSTSVSAALEASVIATGGDSDIAEVAYRMDTSRFITSGNMWKDINWYEFNGTYYRKVNLFTMLQYFADRSE